MRKKLCILTAALMMGAAAAYAQVVPVFSEDFEGSTTGWTFVNGSGTNANQWHVGSATNAVKSGSKAAYISYDGGTTYSYDVNSISRIHLYRDITFPTASPVTRPFMLTFDWKCMGVQSATTIGMACATFGLVLGGLIGGPTAQQIIKRNKLHGEAATNDDSAVPFEQLHNPRLITTDSMLETITMFAVCLSASYFIAEWMTTHCPNALIKIPTFVWALASGILVRNILSRIFRVNVFDRCVDVVGNVALSLFLSMALLSLKLYELVDLAIPLLVILLVQIVIVILYARFVTFRFLGKNYDAAVMTAGYCGFAMGATPTAVANMQAITQKFGMSHKAFLVIPLVGAFFVDIINAFILSFFSSLPFLH